MKEDRFGNMGDAGFRGEKTIPQESHGTMAYYLSGQCPKNHSAVAEERPL